MEHLIPVLMFSWNCIFGLITKLRLKNLSLAKIQQEMEALYVESYIHIWLRGAVLVCWLSLFLHKNVYLVITVASLQAVSWGLYIVVSVIAPPFVSFREVRCLKLDNCNPPVCGVLREGRNQSALNLVTREGAERVVLLLVQNTYTDKAEWIGTGLEFCGNPTHPLFYCQNAVNWPRWNSLHVSNFIFSDSILDGIFLYSIHVFFCFVVWRASRAFGIFSVSHIAFELPKLLKHLCPSHCPFLESYFHHFKSFRNIFPQAKLENCKLNMTHFYLTGHCSTVTYGVAFFQVGNNSGYCTWRWSSCKHQ